MAIAKKDVEVTEYLKRYIAPKSSELNEDEDTQRFGNFVTEATQEQLLKLTEQLIETGDSEFNELIEFLHKTALTRLAETIIERAFPKDTDMTPEKLVDVLTEKINEVFDEAEAEKLVELGVEQCPCGHHVNPHEHAYVESKVTGGKYCDNVCLVRGTGARWVGCTIIDEFGDSYSEQKYFEVMEVQSHG